MVKELFTYNGYLARSNNYLLTQDAITQVSDYDGNVYPVLNLCGKYWMGENLRTTHYNDGTFCGTYWYDDDFGNSTIYGGLYSTTQVLSNKLAPIGWHIPTKQEWIDMFICTGAYMSGNIALWSPNGNVKEMGTDHWQAEVGAANAGNFALRGAGIRTYSDTYESLKGFAIHWTSTQFAPGYLWRLEAQWNTDQIPFYSTGRNEGDKLSIRCIKDY